MAWKRNLPPMNFAISQKARHPKENVGHKGQYGIKTGEFVHLGNPAPQGQVPDPTVPPFNIHHVNLII